MKLAIQIAVQEGSRAMPEAKPLSREQKIQRLLDKIEYAGDCIEYDSNKREAIAFLQKLYHSFSTHKVMKDDTQVVMQECYKKIRDYGILPIMPNDSEKES